MSIDTLITDADKLKAVIRERNVIRARMRDDHIRLEQLEREFTAILMTEGWNQRIDCVRDLLRDAP